MGEVTLQQGESVSMNITLENPLNTGEVLYYAVSDNLKLLKGGSTKDGGIVTVDSSHFIIMLKPEDTVNFTKCTLEFAVSSDSLTMVEISDSAINMNFTPNKIKDYIL